MQWNCPKCQELFNDWNTCVTHLIKASHVPLELCYRSISSCESQCFSCQAKLPHGMLAGRSGLSTHSIACDKALLMALTALAPNAYECPKCKNTFDRWSKCFQHLKTSKHLPESFHIRNKVSQCLRVDLGVPTKSIAIPMAASIPSGPVRSIVAYKCQHCSFQVPTDLSFIVHLLESGHLASQGHLSQQLAMCGQSDDGSCRGGDAPLQSNQPPMDNAKAAKEAKAYDILVEACHKARNGLADPSTLRALQPLLPKGTLKKFIARHADTFKVVESEKSRAGWFVAFNAPGGTTTKKQCDPPPTLAISSTPSPPATLDTTGLLQKLIPLFASQTHTITHTFADPLSTKQVQVAKDAAWAVGLHCHLLAHRFMLSREEITTLVINTQASICNWIYDPKMEEINMPLREFLADARLPSLRTTNVPSKVFKYLEDLSHAGCAFSVIRLPDSSVKILKLAAADSGDVLLKDFFAQTQNTQRIVQLPQQQVSSTIHFDDECLAQLTAATTSAKAPDPKSVNGPNKTGRRATIPRPNAQYGVNAKQVAELRPVREMLPMWGQKEAILSAFHAHRVMVLSGATGSGKTTQLPQFILDDGNLPPDSPIILCTQPRRIAAISVAGRVAQERGQSTGKEVGYQVRFERAVGPDTRLIFLTAGVMLRKIQEDPTLRGIGCVILDEVHERDVNTDFVMLALKQVLHITHPVLA